jgi:hypothetical protein
MQVFSSQADFQLTELTQFLNHLPTANSGTLNPILCCNCQLPCCHYIRMPNLNSQLAGILIIQPWGRPNRKHRFLTILSLLLVYSLLRERVYRVSLAMNVSSGSTIQALRHHITICNTIIHFLDIIHHIVFYLKMFWRLDSVSRMLFLNKKQGNG